MDGSISFANPWRGRKETSYLLNCNITKNSRVNYGAFLIIKSISSADKTDPDKTPQKDISGYILNIKLLKIKQPAVDVLQAICYMFQPFLKHPFIHLNSADGIYMSNQESKGFFNIRLRNGTMSK